MIRGKPYSGRLNVLLLFGDDMNRFEKELIIGYRDNEIGKIVEYEIRKTELIICVDPNGSDEERGFLNYPINEFIEFAIEAETGRALIHLKKDYEERNDYSWHQWIFARILKCYLLALNISETDCPYKNIFIEYFTEIVEKSISLYEAIFGPHFYNLKTVKEKLKLAPKKIESGFKVKSEFFLNISKFTDGLITDGFIEQKDSKYFKEFLKGSIPSAKIDWKKELRFLTYLINQLISEEFSGKPKYLLSPPKQQWKNLDKIFTFKHSSLPPKFNNKFNKLGEKSQKKINSLLLLLATQAN